MPDFEPIRPFSFEEAEPVLQALSKLGHVTAVNPSPFFCMPWPHICWLDAPEFHSESGLAQILYKYPGKGLWYVIPDQPRLCLIVGPNSRNGESPFVVRQGLREEWKERVDAILKRLDESGWTVSWRATPFVDPDQFRAERVLEMAKFGSYLEEALAVQGKPSLGVEFSHESLELPLMEDRAGPGGGVVLVADLLKFTQNGMLTSPFDRRIHFWITEDEGSELCSEISAVEQSVGRSEGRTGWALLGQVAGAGSEYGGLLVYPEQISQLASEAMDFATISKTATAQAALERIQSICRSALNYRLGISIHGKHEG